MTTLPIDISNFGALSFNNGIVGPTGASGNTLIPNGSFESATSNFPLTISNTYVAVASTFVTITQPSKLWSMVTATYNNTSNNTIYNLSTFVTVDSISSFVNVIDLPSRLNNNNPSTTPLTITQISPTEPIGVYKSVLYARTTVPTTTVSCTHCDMFMIGNLA